MSADFDPYYYFLGIPLADRPVDHYRLLGVERFESNTEIIEVAANRQMAYLQFYESGQHAREVARLLSEVAQARLCLLARSTKSAYDAELRSKLSTDDTAPTLDLTDDWLQETVDPQLPPTEPVLRDFLDQLSSRWSFQPTEVESLFKALKIHKGVDREKAELLFQLNDAITANNVSVPGWQAAFVQGICNYALYSLDSPGEVNDEKADWLWAQFSGKSTLDRNCRALLVELKEKTIGQARGRWQEFMEKIPDLT